MRELGLPKVSSGSVVAVRLDEFGFSLVEVLYSPSGPIAVGSRRGGAPAAFEAVLGASEGSSGRCDSLFSRGVTGTFRTGAPSHRCMPAKAAQKRTLPARGSGYPAAMCA